jgi:RimJ/RimL family protein N-acetyltransferase
MTISDCTELKISAWVDSDAPGLFLAMQEEAIYDYIPEVPPTSVEQLIERYGEPLSTRLKDVALIHYTIRNHKEIIGLSQIRCNSTKSFEIGFKLAPSSWGKGYGTWAVMLILKELQTKFTSGTVTARVDSRNLRSAAVLQKNGFVYCGSEKKVLKMLPSIDYVYARELFKDS